VDIKKNTSVASVRSENDTQRWEHRWRALRITCARKRRLATPKRPGTEKEMASASSSFLASRRQRILEKTLLLCAESEVHHGTHATCISRKTLLLLRSSENCTQKWEHRWRALRMTCARTLCVVAPRRWAAAEKEVASGSSSFLASRRRGTRLQRISEKTLLLCAESEVQRRTHAT